MNKNRPEPRWVESFEVVGIQATTSNRNEQSQDSAKIPKLWQDFHHRLAAVSTRSSSLTSNCYGVYSHYKTDVNGEYTLTAGIEAQGNVDQHFPERLHVESGQYLVFTAQGPLPQALIDVWSDIWAYFENQPPYQRRYASDFEHYVNSDRVEIYIGIIA